MTRTMDTIGDRLLAGQEAIGRAVAEQETAHAVLSQWMRDFTAEVVAWRGAMEARMAELEARQADLTRDVNQARGALRVAMWAFGAALTVVTGVFTGVMVRVLGGVVAGSAH
ncbi:MAG TPA: hypothetical protein VGM37_21170 [Armatimonadota bacterium]